MNSPPTTDDIWSELGHELRRFLRRRVADEHVADDLLQETFVRIHRHVGGLQDDERVASWVYRIARNVVHDHYRSQRRTRVAVLDREPVEDAGETSGKVRTNAATWLTGMVDRLPSTYREAVRLAEIEGLPQREVADRLRISLSGAKSRVQRGRRMLKDALERCCQLQFDRRGHLTDCDPRSGGPECSGCDD